jgi:hypothetical protein
VIRTARTARRICQTGVVVGAVVLLAAACKSSSYGPSAAASAAPTVTIIGPPVVKGSTVTLTLGSAGIAIRDADGDASGHSGHYVVFVDREPPPPGTKIVTADEADGVFHTSAKSLAIRGEETGLHQFVAVLADGTNARLGDTEARASATVSSPGLTLSVSQSSASCQGSLVTVTPDGFSLPNVSAQPAQLSIQGTSVVPTTNTTLPSATTTTTLPAPSGETTTAPAPPPALITYWVDRLPTSAAATSADLGQVTAPSLSVCLTGLFSGHHSVWAVTGDSTATPLTVPIEGRITFNT